MKGKTGQRGIQKDCRIPLKTVMFGHKDLSSRIREQEIGYVERRVGGGRPVWKQDSASNPNILALGCPLPPQQFRMAPQMGGPDCSWTPFLAAPL